MAAEPRFALRADLLDFSATPDWGVVETSAVRWRPDHWLLVEAGRIAAVQAEAPGEGWARHDHRGRLVLPGFIDTHVHSAQLDVIASYGTELLDWLNRYTFPAERRYADPEVARAGAAGFLDALLAHGTTAAVVFPTVHKASADALFAAHQRGMRLVAGKVLMDRHAPDGLRDDVDQAERDCRELIARWHGTDRLAYAVTVRFAPTSTPAQLAMAGRLVAEDPTLYLQTHVAENRAEVRWVADLFPEARSYLDVYARAALLHARGVFAHGIWLDAADRAALADAGAQIAHCPSSNLFLGSGLFDWPAATEAGVPVTLASDVGGGTSLSLLRTMSDAYKVQAMAGRRLTAWTALHAATRGAAQALGLAGEIGSFDPGCMADLCVWDWAVGPVALHRDALARQLHERVFAWMMLGDERNLAAAYVAGTLVAQGHPCFASVELIGISKQYPSVRANDRVHLRVAPGQIHAVLGENGAGKSTLMKVIYGAVRPDEGEMRWNGERVEIRNPQQARALGISMVFQHFSLFDTLTAAENVWLGVNRSLTLPEVTQRIEKVSRGYGLDVEPQRPVHTLSVGERQRVEIVRALLTEPKLLILDEPTSVLTPQAVGKLFVTLRQLAAEGCSILYISHKLDEIRALCHHCTVLRGGRVTGEVDPAQESNASLSRLMIGAEPPQLVHRKAQPGAVVLGVQALNLDRADQFGMALDDIGFDVRAGEIVGIAGVSGNGQQELMAALSGEDARAPAGSIRLSGQDIACQSPRRRRKAGLHFVPEERLGRGAVPSMSLAQNTLLTRTEGLGAGGWIRTGALAALAAKLIARFNVKAGGAGAQAKSLSGGNLQKFIVGREIDANPKLLIVSQPTWGVDVGAAALIRAELLALRDAGCALLVVSEELDELFEICDRLVVIAQGRVSPPIAVADATIERIGEWMSGLWAKPAAAPPPPAAFVAQGPRHAQA